MPELRDTISEIAAMNDDSKAMEAAKSAMRQAEKVWRNQVPHPDGRYDVDGYKAQAAVRAYLAQREADSDVIVPVVAAKEQTP